MNGLPFAADGTEIKKVWPFFLYCGYALANAGHDTRALQAYLGHRNIQNMTRYTALAQDRFARFWQD